MDEAQARRWNERYANSDIDDTVEACYALQHFRHVLPDPVNPDLTQPRTALDLACGRGGNALLLSRIGFTTHAWDISSVAIESLARHAAGNGLAISAVSRDVVAEPPAASAFDVIVVSRFLDRSITSALVDALCPGGILVYQTFSVRARTGPGNPSFRLKDNELLELFAPLKVRVYQDFGDESLLVAQKLFVTN